MQRRALVLCLALSILFSFAQLSFAQPYTAANILALKANPKVNVTDTALDRLSADAHTVRVIVNLRDPLTEDAAAANSPLVRSATAAARRSVNGLRDASVRRQLVNDVRAMQQQVIEAHHVDSARVSNWFSYHFGFSAELTPEEIQSLADSADVLSIEEDKLIQAQVAQGIPLMSASIISDTYGGAGMSIAICDTGIDYTHPMLGGGGFPNAKVIGGYDTGEDDADPMDGNGHGTACAGIAAGDLNNDGDYIGGVAYDAKLYALKMTYSPTSNSAYTSAMAEAWEWCITHQNDDPANPIMIISTSFGGGKYTDQATCDGASSAMAAAAANAKAVGITIFVSSGNDGYCDATGWPACLSDVISVGAVYDADFGNYYPCVSEDSCASKIATASCSTGYYSVDSTVADRVTSYSNTASFLSLLAPSNAAYTTKMGGGYTSTTSGFGGTSAACPYAAGAAASLQSAAKARTGAFLTPEQLELYLTNNGDLITDSKVEITKPRINLGQSADAILSVPLLTTDAATSVTAGSAMVGGSVVDDGGDAVTARGVCWSLSSGPTTDDSCTNDGTGSGSFTEQITSLLPSAVYHVRAYATNSFGTGYGQNITFTTLSIPADARTDSAQVLSHSSVTLSGTVNPNGAETDYHFEYGPDQAYSATTTNSSIGSGRSESPASTVIGSLAENTTYHYRLIATNAGGTSYGEDQTFTTLPASRIDTSNTSGSGGGGCFITTAADSIQHSEITYNAKAGGALSID